MVLLLSSLGYRASLHLKKNGFSNNYVTHLSEGALTIMSHRHVKQTSRNLGAHSLIFTVTLHQGKPPMP